MRRSLLLAALLASTALTPVEAKADPVTGFFLGSIGVSSGAAAGLGVAVGATSGFAAGVTFAGTAIGGFVVRTVLAIGLSAVARQLAPKPAVAPPASRMVNFAQAIAYAEWAYGRTRKGGPIGFTGFKNGRRYYVPILAAHPIEGVVEHWLDERTVTLTTEADPEKSNIATSPIAGYGRIDVMTGGPAQVANPGLVSAFTEMTAAHDFKGLSGATIWAARPPEASFTEIYPSGRQWAYAPVIDGKNDLFDPRDSTSGFSGNAARVIADWIVNIRGSEVDWDEVAEEADTSDEIVINAEGDPQPRWTLNGTISDEQDYEDHRVQLAAAADVYFYERTDGKVGFRVGRWEEPTLTLDIDDFYDLQLTEGQWGADAPDEVAVVYTEPANAWRETPTGSWVENAVAKPVKEEPRVFMISNHNQGARVAKRLARSKRAKYQLTGTIGMAGYEILGGREGGGAHRIIRVLHPPLGIDQAFEVGMLSRESFGMFTLTANSVEPEDFAFDAATEEPERPSYGVTVVSDGSVPVPASLTGTALPQGTIQYAWPAQDAAFTQEVRYRIVGDTHWLTARTSESAEVLQVTGLADGATVEAQVRNRTAGAGASPWGPEPPIETVVVVNPTPPGDLTDFDVTEAGDGQALVEFTAPNDGQYFGTRIWRGTTATFGSAALVHTEYGIPSAGDSYTDAAGYGTFYYWAAPINSSGIAGTIAGPEPVTLSAPGP
ncbi:hypothetical protein ACFO5X_10210 [Seohaeicola nanhaiensis]|uniref:Tip attachment protein J domain-containing protein n=1 Tax=Seohaeicola nanhaiensis TaxID=1387282 RepID=A0ABV9KFL1_9RHOB